MKLSFEQKKVLAEFCANFAVAWLAAGIVAPFIIGRVDTETIRAGAMSLGWAGFLLTFMLFLTKGGKQ